MFTLMQRDAPGWGNSVASGEDDIISIRDDPQSDVEMESHDEQPEQHSEDSLPDSGSEGSNNPLAIPTWNLIMTGALASI